MGWRLSEVPLLHERKSLGKGLAVPTNHGEHSQAEGACKLAAGLQQHSEGLCDDIGGVGEVAAAECTEHHRVVASGRGHPEHRTGLLDKQIPVERRVPADVLRSKCQHCKGGGAQAGLHVQQGMLLPFAQPTHSSHMGRVDAPTIRVRIKRLLPWQILVEVANPHPALQHARAVVRPAVRPEAQENGGLAEDVLLLAATGVLEAPAAVVAVGKVQHGGPEAPARQQHRGLNRASRQRHRLGAAAISSAAR
mmetsp:Transcript_111539/g.310609  ORF Transcript_111539/g.310609 Transcript_111539/m.310609 type:complete len:250 (+) Transcript_111539:427-1176(+)